MWAPLIILCSLCTWLRRCCLALLSHRITASSESSKTAPSSLAFQRLIPPSKKFHHSFRNTLRFQAIKRRVPTIQDWRFEKPRFSSLVGFKNLQAPIRFWNPDRSKNIRNFICIIFRILALIFSLFLESGFLDSWSLVSFAEFNFPFIKFFPLLT